MTDTDISSAQNPAYMGSVFLFFVNPIWVRKMNWLIKFLEVDIWKVTPGEVTPFRFFCYGLVKRGILAVRFFTKKQVMVQASALTYSTLLAIVPILSVMFAIARGFGYNKYIEVWFRDLLSSQPQAADAIVGFVNSYLVHTKSGVFLGVGLIFMLYTVLMLVSNIEQAFNHIWQVKRPRSIFRTFTDYLAMFFLFPILIVVSSGLSIYVATMAQRVSDVVLVEPLLRTLLRLLPYVLMSCLFIALYVFMPNTHVKVRHAIVPGLLAGIAMQWLQFFYIHSQLWMTGHNAIYGSFAALPLFMFWVQISWTICLFGAELTYTNQNLDFFDDTNDIKNLSHRNFLLLSAIVMGRICRRFAQGATPYSAMRLREETGIPIRVVNDLLYRLIEAKLVIEIAGDEKGGTSQYVPYESLENLSVGVMIDRLEAKGRWGLELDIGQYASGDLMKAIRLRTKYLNNLRDVKLENL